ncbi:hypothetical protein [Hyphomicrobium sp.]|uniref:hypothetical protein n=1 Tax=Hyphomicrobium sp. TaxID=82 RepID=UPI000F9BA5F4|nr:hypothetical protein [Hyphomicrobium sp.]RUO97537.1 MAG: hypothetical protein EKK30_16215 [Hyphomicrobium sp.]
MYARTSYADDEFPSFIAEEIERQYEADGFYAGTPVCPQPQRRLQAVPFSSLILILAVTVTAAFAADEATRQEWVSKAERIASAVSAAGFSSPSTVPAPPTKDVASLAPAQPISLPPAALPSSAATQPLPEVTVSNAPGDKPDAEASAAHHVSDAYAPPPPTSDPYSKKAEAAGLHPDLSRVVLARLTPTDYRNAAYAIQKALKTVPDDGQLTWPRSRKAGTAVFTVHFVEGAGHDCRRYVVTITKDRWTSTALPMEKCGVKVAFRSAGKDKSIE